MDRLHAVRLASLGLWLSGALAVAGAVGCERGGGDKKKEPPESGDRVDSVQAGKPDKQVSLEEFCDVRAKTAASSPTVSLPPLAGGKSAPGKGTWRWLNLWATWCKPCIEEMPQLAAWHEQLAKENVKFDLVFVSVDDSDDLIERFREKHPDAPPTSLRLADAEALPKWLGAIGLGESAPIPVHVFVDPDDHVRCVRAGGVKEKDLSAVKAVLGSP